MPAPISNVQLTRDGTVTVLSFSKGEDGLVHLEPVKLYLATRMLEHTAGIDRMVIDLSGVASLDSSCLGPLIQKLRLVQQAKGRLVLTGIASPALEEILALTRFDKVFPILKTRAEAVALAAG